MNSKNVLLVEDNDGIRELLEIFLSTLNVSFVSAGDGEEAIQLLKENTYDVLITDFRMPKVDGVELLQWCRENKRHFPVIFISADAELVPKEKIALEDCCATLLPKPFEILKLERALDAAMKRVHHEDCLHSKP